MSSDLESGDKGGKIQDDPLSVLQEYADVWEYNKKRSVRIFSKPVMLEAFVTAFLGDLSGVVLSDNSDHQKSYWDLMAQCYEHLPGPSHSKPWSLLQGYDAKDDSNVYYDRVIPMVNSSGLGKSKLVYELGRQVFEHNHHNS